MPTTIETLKNREDVEILSTLKYEIYFQNEKVRLEIQTDFELRQSYETLEIIGIDTWRLTKLFPEITEEQRQAFIDGKFCLIKNPISIATQGEAVESTSLGVGDYLSIADRYFNVLGNCDAVTVADGYSTKIQISS